jgi:hypothetical protein
MKVRMSWKRRVSGGSLLRGSVERNPKALCSATKNPQREPGKTLLTELGSRDVCAFEQCHGRDFRSMAGAPAASSSN